LNIEGGNNFDLPERKFYAVGFEEGFATIVTPIFDYKKCEI